MPNRPDFSQPLLLFKTYHSEILRQLERLEAWVQELEAGAEPDHLSRLGTEVDRFFALADRLHHQDEELDLFPRLQQASSEMTDMIRDLKQQHREAETLWRTLSPSLTQPGHIDDRDAVSRQARRYLALQREHVRIENESFLTLAGQQLSDKDLQQIGSAMARRRGVAWRP